MEIQPLTLAGRIVRLVPLSLSHVPELTRVAADESIWSLMPFGFLTTEERMAAHVRETLERQVRGTDLPFTVFHQESGRIVGCTRYLDIQPENRGLEIGGTWYGVAYQRTGVNTECKYLLLRHAFETLGCHRVQLKTDLRNVRSQTAIERIGALKEGVLRENVVMPDGYLRSTVMFSILEEEWPAVKARLERLMERGGTS
jgi:RimJ/RimL family protein N-acetyltransferase